MQRYRARWQIKMRISQYSVFDYFLKSREYRNSLSDHYAGTEKITILGAETESECKGFLLMNQNRCYNAVCLEGDSDAKKALLQEAAAYAKQENTYLRVMRLLDETSGEYTDQALLGAWGFQISEEANLYTYRKTEQSFEFWKEFTKSLVKLKAYCEKRYVLKSFAELTEEERMYIVNNSNNEFPTYLGTEDVIRDQYDMVCREMSFAALLDGLPVAYVLFTRIRDKQLMLNSRAVSKKVVNRGLSFYCLQAAIEVFLEKYESISGMIYATNSQSLPLMERHFKGLNFACKKAAYFVKKSNTQSEGEFIVEGGKG